SDRILARNMDMQGYKVGNRRIGPDDGHLDFGGGSSRRVPSDFAQALTLSWRTVAPRSTSWIPFLIAATCHSWIARYSSIASAATNDLLRRTRAAAASSRFLTLLSRRTVRVVLSVISQVSSCWFVHKPTHSINANPGA